MGGIDLNEIFIPILGPIKIREILENLRRHYKDFKASKPKASEQLQCLQIEADRAGLLNSGNSCYLNSVMQALFMTQRFCDPLLKSNITDKQIFGGLQKLFAQMSVFHHSVLSSEEMWKLVDPERFGQGQQHDSSEYLITLFQMLQEEDEKVSDCNTSSDLCSSNQNLKKENLVRKVFGGALNVHTTCSNCGTVTMQKDCFTELQICMPRRHIFSWKTWTPSVDLKNVVKTLLCPEKLGGENKYFCNKCDGYQEATRIQKFAEAPECLILIVNRFKYVVATRHQIKQMRKVRYADTLDIEVKSHPPQLVTYKFYAAVVHSGHTVESGHYYTISRDAEDNWLRMDDDKIVPISIGDVQSLNPPDTPYILFYSEISRSLKPAVSSSDYISLTSLEPSLATYIVSECQAHVPRSLSARKVKQGQEVLNIKKRICKQILQLDCLPRAIKEYAYNILSGQM